MAAITTLNMSIQDVLPKRMHIERMRCTSDKRSLLSVILYISSKYDQKPMMRPQASTLV